MGVHNRKKQHGFGSVQPRDAEVVGDGIDKKNIIKIIILILLVALIAGAFAFFKSDSNNELKDKVSGIFKGIVSDDTEEGEDSVAINIKDGESQVSSIVVGSSNFSKTEKVKLAILASPDLFDYKNNRRLGCDALVVVEAEVVKTPKVLNNTLDLLFNDDFNYGFSPANFISSTQKDLNFDHAIIANGIAKVFLTGKMSIEDTKCDSERIVHQITETTKQFNTVKSVEIYLNSEKVEL